MKSLATIEREVRRGVFLPAPTLTLPEWSDAYALIPKDTGSAEPGRWRTDRVPYLRGIMDAYSDPAIEEVVVMKASRVGYTASLMNAIAMWMADDPSNILAVLPDEFTTRTWSRTYLGPMIRDTPRLSGLVKESAEGGARHGGNATLRKEFPGGSLVAVWSSSTNRLRNFTARRVVLDEIDGMEPTPEGDPIALAEKRAESFQRRRKILKGSSPTIKGKSLIEKAFDFSDRRYFMVPCPACGHRQRLLWGHLHFDDEAPEEVTYRCAECAVLIPHAAKNAMVAAGDWEITRPGRRIAGFHVSALYSPFVSWAFLRKLWEEAQGDNEKLKTFVNTALGETWEIRGEQAGPNDLLARRGLAWPNATLLPAGVGLLTAAADVQKDRIEYQVEGWGEGEENWKVDYGVIVGDPALQQPWIDLDSVLRRHWRHASGNELAIRCAVVDAGHLTREVYAFTGPKYGRRIYAVKGLSKGDARGLVRKKPTVDDKTGTRFFLFSPNTAKDTLFARLRVVTPGPRYVNLPDAAWCNQDWVDGLLSEEVFYGKTGKRRYDPIRKRNEPLDLSVMNLVALGLSGVPSDRLGRRAALLAGGTVPMAAVTSAAAEDETDPEPPARVHKRRRIKPRHSWIRGE